MDMGSGSRWIHVERGGGGCVNEGRNLEPA